MTMTDDERGFDEANDDADDRLAATLREVTVPAAVRATELTSLFDDASIDRLLRAVPCPPAAIERMLRPSRGRTPVDLAIAASRLGEAGTAGGRGGARIDAAAFPSASRSAERRPWHVLRLVIRGAMDGASVAVVLVVAAGLLWASATASRWLSSPGPVRRDADMRSADLVAAGRDSMDAKDAKGTSAVPGPSTAPPSSADADPVSSGVVAAATRPADDRERIPEGPVGRSVESGFDSRLADETLTGFPPVDGGIAIGDRGGRSPSDALTARVRAAPADRAILGPSGPPMGVVSPTRSASRPVPSHRGYDLAFEMAHGVPPFVDPSLAPALAVDRPPLSTRTDTFDAAVRAAVGGRRVRESLRALRVEHVLAALPPASVPASVSPGAGRDPVLSMRGFPTFRSGVASRFLEIEASVPPSIPPAGAGDPSRIVLVLDASSAAAADEAWPAVCRAVRGAASGMDADARMSVVLFADRPVVAAEGIDRRGIVALCDRLERLRLRGGGNLHGSMPEVHRLLARSSGGGRPRCVVVAHVGSIARAERDGDEDLAAWRSAHAGDEPSSGLVDEYVVIDPARGLVGAAAMRGEASPIDGIGLDAESIRRRIVEAVRGESPADVGNSRSLRDCRLEVAFDPRQVAAYRLVGHRQQVSDFDRSAVSTIDLEPGLTVRVVYEVMLKSQASQKSPPPPVARSTFHFRRSGDGGEGKAEASIMASDFRLDPPAGDPLAWAVWLGVGLAEHAAGSPHVESRADLLRRLQDRAARWGDAGWAEPSMRRLLLVLRAAAGEAVREQVDAVEFDGAD